MEFDTEKIKGLLSKEDESMNHENGMYMPVAPLSYGHNNNNDGGFGGNNSFFSLLLAYGLIDRNGNRTGQNATQEQVQHLATTTGLSDVAIKSKLDAMQISSCEQTSTLKDAIYNSSSANAMGQNALGEKVTGIGYRVESNAKDIEKTVLVDGGLTRKNDDDNSGKNLTAQTIGFHNVEKSLCHLESNLTAQHSAHDSKMSAEHCEIKGLIKDVKYDLTREIEAKGNVIIAQASQNHNDSMAQASQNHNDSMAKMERIQTENLLLNKNDELRDQQREIDALKTATHLAQYNDLKEGQKKLECDNKRDTEINILSKNIGSVIGNAFDGFREDFRGHCDRQNLLIGNTLQLGLRNSNNSNNSNGNGNGNGHGNNGHGNGN